MDRFFSLKTTFILFFLMICQLGLKAQTSTTPPAKDTTRLILVVTPGKTYPKPAGSTPQTVPANKKTSKAVHTTTTGYAAPTTAERSGTAVYMVPVTVKKGANSAALKGNPMSAKDTAEATFGSFAPKSIHPSKKDTVLIKKTDTVIIYKPEPVQRTNKILFGEVGGPGLAISLNYDARFTSDPGKLGFRIGAGYYGTGGNTVFTIPFQVNYLFALKNSSFIEIGLGTTFLNSTGDNTGKTFIFDRVTGFIGTGTIGYRYQSDDKKINFRIGFVPILYDEGIIAAGGVSIGYTFKGL